MAKSIPSVQVLVTVVAAGAAAAIAATLPSSLSVVRDQPADVAGILALTLVLEVLVLRLPGKGSLNFASLGLVLAAITLGLGPAMLIGAIAGLVRWIRTRGRLNRALFDAGNMAVAAGTAAVTYNAITAASMSGVAQFVAAATAGGMYVAINHSLVCLAMSISESRSPRLVWRERFHWARYYLLAFMPLAGSLTVGDAQLRLGVIVSLAFSLALLVRMRRDLRAHAVGAHGRPA